MKVAPLITVALILCIACPGLIQAKKKPKPKFCIGKNGVEYAVGDGYIDMEEDVCIRYRCVKKKKKVFMKENKCIDVEWTNWSSWSACTATCGNATRTKERTCSILPPITKGNQCSGPDQKIEECSLPKCSHVHRSGQNSLDSILLEIANIKVGINTNKAGIMENKAAIAGHHGVLLHTDANSEYYKVPVPASSKMTSAVVLTTCIKLGMKPQCFRADYADSNCVQAPSNKLYGLNPYEMSKILCSTTRPENCASTLNMFWYMNPDKGYASGSACGATKAGFCSAGIGYTSTSDMQYFAACLKPVNTVLLHTDANYEYYKVPVPASSKMTSAVVLTTCIKLGMKPQCFNAYNADSNCVQAPSTSIHSQHPKGLSQILCSTVWPQDCTTLNMFWYLNPDSGWYSGSACGATKAGGFCSIGISYTSTSDMQYFAACLKPVTTG